MPTTHFVSVTRLKLRSLRFLLPFMIEATRSRKQASRSPGCLGVAVRKTRGLAFWTLTTWESQSGMRAFMTASPHRDVMPKLAHWCDEAAVEHWDEDSGELPGWERAADQLAKLGRLSRVSHPSAAQAGGRINID